ncbi:MAG: alkylmercury lyase family protein [Gemmatimonadota bacterium]|nr:MAG: alkylmercury lyase family protein [Gemmatimonadota bacterium]
MSAIKPEATERTKNIFEEACCVENMEAKFGKTLSPEENDVKRFILTQSPVLGRIPSIDEIKKAFTQYQDEKMDAILKKLDQYDVIHLDENEKTIAAAYPFSGSETSHTVTLKREGYGKIYTMCAIDALGVPFMFQCDVSIDSKCHHCGESIEIEIEDKKITFLKPESTVVWCDLEYSCCAATSLCKNINFFSSEHHFTEWQKENQRVKGHLLQLNEAFYLGKLFFENRLH